MSGSIAIAFVIVIIRVAYYFWMKQLGLFSDGTKDRGCGSVSSSQTKSLRIGMSLLRGQHLDMEEHTETPIESPSSRYQCVPGYSSSIMELKLP